MFDDSLGAEMSLAVNVRDDFRGSDYHELHAVTAFVANLRHTLEYTPWPDAHPVSDWNTVVGSLSYSMTLGDDQGAFVSLDQGDWVWYYGVWYNSFWVSENGFLVFDASATNADGKFNNPTPPSTIPILSSSYPTSFAAAYWKNLHGGTIKYGYDLTTNPDSFTVAWDGVLDANNNPQKFYARIYVPTQGVATGAAQVEYYYESLSTTSGIKVGLENQEGTLGYDLDPYYYLVQHKMVTIMPDYHDFNTIADVKISASKWVSNPSTNDNDASIGITGTGTLLYPGGVNVVLMSYEESQYLLSNYGTAMLDAGIITAELLTDVLFPEFIPVTTPAFAAIDLVMALSESCDIHVPSPPDPNCRDAVLNPAPNGDQTAYAKNRGMEENLPGGVWKYYPWDVAYFPVFKWVYNPTSTAGAHHLDINVEVGVYNQLTTAYTTIRFPVPISLTMNNVIGCSHEGSGVGWSGRTNPDGSPYAFTASCNPSTGYLTYGLTEARQADDPVYTMYGWTRLTGDPPYDFTTDSSGGFQVSGSFTFNDGLSGSNLQYSGANLYVLNPVNTHRDGQQFDDRLDNIIQTIPLFTSADSGQRGTLVTKNFCVGLGSAWANKPVKVAYGRAVSVPGYSMSVGWTQALVTTPGCPTFIEGYVKNSGGTPISGAVVTVTPPVGSTSTVTTDSNGHYSYAVSDLGRYLLSAAASGYISYCSSSAMTAYGTTNRLDFTLSTATASISPIYVWGNGAYVSGASVVVRNCYGTSVWSGSTDSSGRANGVSGLSHGTFTVTATWTDWSECTGEAGQKKWVWRGDVTLVIPPNVSPTVTTSRYSWTWCPT